MNILGRSVVLRALEEDDIPLLHEWGNDPALWPLLGGWHFPVARTVTKAWFDKLSGDALNQRFAVTTEADGLVGLANLLDIDWKNNHAFHGMFLGSDKIRGKGIGLDTIMAIMRYAFDELHFERLDGSMIEFNAASLHVYCDKCAWQVEGRQRNWYFRQGRYWDRVVVGVTREAYRSLVERTHYWD
jgi:RimJ/RimL family protein N-acetyltransferase